MPALEIVMPCFPALACPALYPTPWLNFALPPPAYMAYFFVVSEAILSN